MDSSDDANNLVFGTWECNTNMIRVESLVTEITSGDGDKDYKGILTTTSDTSTTKPVQRFGLGKKPTPETIPDWVGKKEYCKLCVLSWVMVPDERHSLALFITGLSLRDETV